MPKILGFSVEGEEWVEKVVGIIQGLPQTNLYSVVVGVGTIVIIRVLKRFAPRIPGALVALILMTVVVAVFQLEQRGVSVLGAVPAGLPQLTLPRVTALDYLSLLPGAVAICGITLAEAVLVGRTYAERRGYPLDADQEMFAFGAANVVGGVTGSFVTGSSGSRTAAMDAAGSRSQIPGVVGAGVVAVVLVFFTPFLALLPSAALAGIVANAVLALVEIEGLRELKRLRQSEFAIAVVCLASVLLLGTINAVVLAFLLTVIDVVRRAATPATAVLGELPDHRGQLVAGDPDQLFTLPGLVIYRFGAALFFANADTFRRDVQRLIETSVPAPTWFVLDAEAISDIDTTGCDTLARVLDDLQQRGVTFAMTRVAPSILTCCGTTSCSIASAKSTSTEPTRTRWGRTLPRSRLPQRVPACGNAPLRARGSSLSPTGRSWRIAQQPRRPCPVAAWGQSGCLEAGSVTSGRARAWCSPRCVPFRRRLQWSKPTANPMGIHAVSR